MHPIETPAIILRTIDFGESDRVVTMMGRSVGCVGAIARGARKSQRRFGGGLGLCSIGDAALRERAGSDLMTLERFDVTASHPNLAGDVERIAQAGYAAELVTKMCAPRQPEPLIFDLLLELLTDLDRSGVTSERLRRFELALLDRLGLAPVLDACAVCGREDLSVGSDIDVRWNPRRGGVVCRACGAEGRPMRAIVRLTLARLAASGRDGANATAAGQLSGASATPGAPEAAPTPADVGRGCRDALAELIAGHLSAPLRSLEFLAKISPELDARPSKRPGRGGVLGPGSR